MKTNTVFKLTFSKIKCSNRIRMLIGWWEKANGKDAPQRHWAAAKWHLFFTNPTVTTHTQTLQSLSLLDMTPQNTVHFRQDPQLRNCKSITSGKILNQRNENQTLKAGFWTEGMYTKSLQVQSTTERRCAKITSGKIFNKRHFKSSTEGRYIKLLYAKSWTEGMHTKSLRERSSVKGVYTKSVQPRSWTEGLYSKWLHAKSWTERMYAKSLRAKSSTKRMYTKSLLVRS